MPLIEIHLADGRTDEQKKKLLASVTQAVQESIGAPLESIRVWIHEFSAHEYMASGELLADRRAAASAKRSEGRTNSDR